MLLNQCLAISLSPISSGGDQAESSSQGLESSGQRFISKLEDNSATKNQQTRPDSTLFEELIAQNTTSRIENNNKTTFNNENTSQEKVQALKEALDRVEFAGFVMPSWLLLSGSYNDLHCIKTSWSEGNFKSPTGFKIETIGNIRSVNVDYLNNNESGNNIKKFNHGDEFSHQESNNHQLNVQEKQQRKQTSQVYQERLSRLQKSTVSSRFTSKSLETAILDSLSKLKQLQEPNSIVNVRSLVEYLASSNYADLVNYYLLKDSKSIDYTIKSLVKNGRLCLSYSQQKPSTNRLENHELQQQSVFLDQLISFSDDDNNIQTSIPPLHENRHHNHQSSRDSTSSGNSSGRISVSNDTENDRETLSGERRSRLCSLTNTSTTNKSKSTTLDSGIQSWDQLLSDVGPAVVVNCDDLATDTTTRIMYSASVVDGQLSATQKEQQGQVVEQEPSSFANHTTFTVDNSCDTTGASQQQPKRSAGRREQVEKPASHRSFSLGRSFSFRNKKIIPVLDGVENQQPQEAQRREKMAPSDKWKAKVQESDTFKNDTLTREKRGQNLSSLFRSKSMRTIPTGRNNQLGKMKQQHSRGGICNAETYQTRVVNDDSQRQQATIDYLASAQHKRSFSIRRNSLLTFNTRDTNESSGGKIVLFLRKLFNIKRSRQRQNENENHINNPKVRIGSVESRNSTNNGYRNYGDNSSITMNRFGTERTHNDKVSSQTQTHDNIIVETLRSSTSSSASSSLIEILDCSKIVDSSRRPFKETPTCNLVEFNNNKQRATTRWTSSLRRSESAIRRSDSSLSHNSEASCSTTKSTVSQQLRRHLDEAYKRHRNCNSQQEREFIDSINVLRQASRHALPAKLSSSRSSSKNRHQTNKSVTSSSAKSGSTINDDTSINSSSYCATRSFNSRANQENNNYYNRLTKCNCNKQDDEYYNALTKMNIENDNNALRQQHLQFDQSPHDLDLIHKSSARKPLLENGNTSELKQQPNLDYDFGAPTLNDSLEDPAMIAARLANCCVCNSYLNSAARMCPLTCFPPLASINPQTSCLSPNSHQNNMKPFGKDLHLMQKMLPTSEVANEFCCPLWQSMLYNYCPPFYLTASQPTFGTDQTALQLTQASTMMPEQHQHQEQQQQAQTQLSRLENFSSQHQLQQHQHNTTIDLKIEIAPAEFSKMKKMKRNRDDGKARGRLQDKDDSLESSGSPSCRSGSGSTSASVTVTDESSSVVCEIEADRTRRAVKDEESPLSSLLPNDQRRQDHTSCQPVERESERDSCESDSTYGHFSTRSKSDSLEPQQEQDDEEEHSADRLFRQANHLEADK